MRWADVILYMFLGFYLGNYMGDSATLKDCATKQEAVMAGGGTIICTIKTQKTTP